MVRLLQEMRFVNESKEQSLCIWVGREAEEWPWWLVMSRLPQQSITCSQEMIFDQKQSATLTADQRPKREAVKSGLPACCK